MSEKWVGWLALVVSVFALGLSTVVFYYSDLRGPDIFLAVGHDVLVTKTTSLGPRIGVICSFVNEGAQQTIITNATLDVDSPSITLSLAMVGDSFGAWEESEGKFTASPTKYNLAAPIPVRGHDKAAAIFWFEPMTSFEFTPGLHQFTLNAISQNGAWKRHFDLDITSYNIANIGKTPYADHPISVVSQN
jgi:hypothetical protein